MNETIEVTDLGPIERLSIPVPEEGGVMVLLGRNGSGKSHALGAVETLLRGNGALEHRDGTLRGSLEGLGVRITVSRSTRRSGELECTSLEGRLNVADLVDPGLKDPAAADAKRIKALVSLSGVVAEFTRFEKLLGNDGELTTVIRAQTAGAADLIDMAAKVKRALESEARRLEGMAIEQAAKAKALCDSAAGVDLSIETDDAKLQRFLELAMRDEADLAASMRAAGDSAAAAEDARTRMAAIESSDATRLTVEQAEAELAVAGSKVTSCSVAVASAQRKFDEAKAELSRAEAELKGAQADAEKSHIALKAARDHAELVAGWRKSIEAAEGIYCPSRVEYEAALRAVHVARDAIGQAAVVRRAKQQIAEADAHAAQGAKATKRAEAIREAARLTDDVLSEAVACQRLRVEGGRLVLTTARGATYFSDLSEGERWKLAIDVAADRVGKHGLLVIPQPAWEALDPRNRRLVAEKVRERRVRLLTAEAADGELRAESFEPAC